MGYLEKTDWRKKIIWVVLVQILFERCSKCFQDILQKFEKFGSKVCNNLHLEMEHFWLELELIMILKHNLKRKCLSWFQKCISKRSLPKWFERVENYLIWFPKSFIPKRTWCIKSFVWLQKKMGIENLLSLFLK